MNFALDKLKNLVPIVTKSDVTGLCLKYSGNKNILDFIQEVSQEIHSDLLLTHTLLQVESDFSPTTSIRKALFNKGIVFLYLQLSSITIQSLFDGVRLTGSQVDRLLQFVGFSFAKITGNTLILFIKFVFTDLGENTAITKYFDDAIESDEEEKDYYFSNSD